jgi:hypothetical protein
VASLTLGTQGMNACMIFFGFFNLFTGYLIFRSTFLPRIVGALLSFAGACYLIDYFTWFANPAGRTTAAVSDLGREHRRTYACLLATPLRGELAKVVPDGGGLPRPDAHCEPGVRGRVLKPLAVPGSDNHLPVKYLKSASVQEIACVLLMANPDLPSSQLEYECRSDVLLTIGPKEFTVLNQVSRNLDCHDESAAASAFTAITRVTAWV